MLLVLGPPSATKRARESKATEHLGFTPAYDLEAGIKDYIATIERLRPQ